MALKLIDKGSQYALIDQAKDGEYFDGSQNYKVNIPANVPAKTSGPWWLTTRKLAQSCKQANHCQVRIISVMTLSKTKMVQSICTLARNHQKGKEANWIETVPGKGWFAILRLYGPQEAWYDKTWKPGDVERVE